MSATTRRTFLERAAAGAAGTAFGGSLLDQALASASPRAVGPVPLPSPEQIRANVQRMVDFGPRHPGYVAHDAFCNWLEDEFVAAGLELIPCDEYVYPDRWNIKEVALEIVDGPSPGALPVAWPWVRSAPTGPEGITAPLSYGGVTRGSIAVIDIAQPAKATAGVFLPLSSYRYWPGHTDADWSLVDYTRAWLMQGSLWALAAAGARAVVFIGTGSYEGMKGSFTPHRQAREAIPAVVVDRDTGATLREMAIAGRVARLTLDAPFDEAIVRNVTAVLPGEVDETIIVNTHTDGQNAVEENGAVTLVHFARHFGSLPAGQRLERTLVLAAWSAHMTDGSVQPQAEGWIAAHNDLVEQAVGAITIEHLGCTEWVDDPVKGYVGTGENEIYGIWTTQGPTFDLARPLVGKHDLVRHALMRPPVQITVGGVFHDVGVPHVGGIAGPTYLLKVSDSGEMEKLDFALMAKQEAFYADVVRAFDTADPKALRTGDPTLGNTPIPTDSKSKPASCGPADRFVANADGNRLAVRFYGRRHLQRGVLVTVAAVDGVVRDTTVELRRGKTLYARATLAKADAKVRSVVLRRGGGKRFPTGSYSLVVRRRGKALLRRTVHVGGK